MYSKVEVRHIINQLKEEYNKGNKLVLLNIAILKGYYLAIGGTKGIAVPAKYNDIVTFSRIVFQYKIKLEQTNDIKKSYEYWCKLMIDNGRNPFNYLDGKCVTSNNDLIELLCELISNQYTVDIIINKDNIYGITLKLLDNMKGGK